MLPESIIIGYQNLGTLISKRLNQLPIHIIGHKTPEIHSLPRARMERTVATLLVVLAQWSRSQVDLGDKGVNENSRNTIIREIGTLG